MQTHMEIDVHRDGLSGSSGSRSFNGCWTCRLRRKKCDENHPICDTCKSLQIACHYDSAKPEWMDGGVRQEEMAERFKRDIKELRRRGDLPTRTSDRQALDTTRKFMMQPQDPLRDLGLSTADLKTTSASHENGLQLCPQASTLGLKRDMDCTLTGQDLGGSIPFGRSDTIFLMFYLEHLFSFMFPFYRPSPLQGGCSWVLELMISSPVVRQSTLCQSSYFFSLALEGANSDVAFERVLRETKNAFAMLRRALQVLQDSNITQHLLGAARILTSIIQLQRFEIVISSFDNCQAHLNAAVNLFIQLLESSPVAGLPEPDSRFASIMGHLGLPSWGMRVQCNLVPTAEQAAFTFSTSVLIFDDIIASTALREEPKLYRYHFSLLGGDTPSLNLEDVIGCNNCILLAIGEIAVLDVWKQQSKKVGSLDVEELFRRGTIIRNTLEVHLMRLQANPVIQKRDPACVLSVFTADYGQQSKTPASQTIIVTRIWTHAALAYLFVVTSGWQPTNEVVRNHVRQIVLLLGQISPPTLLRTMVWPFYVAGCLAELDLECQFRATVEKLQPPSVFGTVHKALEGMENVWSQRDVPGDAEGRDLATCFRSQGELVLLV